MRNQNKGRKVDRRHTIDASTTDTAVLRVKCKNPSQKFYLNRYELIEEYVTEK